MPDHDALEAAYLGFMLRCIELRDLSLPMEPLLKRWFAFNQSRGGSNVYRRPEWDAPASVAASECIPKFVHFVSREAASAIAAGTHDRLVFELAIPAKCIRAILFEAKPGDQAELRTLLRRLYRVGLISLSEQDALSLRGLSWRMPGGWSLGDPLYARFEAAGILIQELKAEHSARLSNRAMMIRTEIPFYRPSTRTCATDF